MTVTAFNRRRREIAAAKAEAEAEKARQPKPLDRMNKDELTAKAAELGIALPADAVKKQILELIEEKLAADAAEKAAEEAKAKADAAAATAQTNEPAK